MVVLGGSCSDCSILRPHLGGYHNRSFWKLEGPLTPILSPQSFMGGNRVLNEG